MLKIIIYHIYHNVMVNKVFVQMNALVEETMLQLVCIENNGKYKQQLSSIFTSMNSFDIIITVMADRKKMVTSIKFKRPLQTNEPINDLPIPTDGFVSVIAAIGPLNSRQEANAHSHDGMNVNSDDIQIDFTSKVIYSHEFRR